MEKKGSQGPKRLRWSGHLPHLTGEETGVQRRLHRDARQVIQRGDVPARVQNHVSWPLDFELMGLLLSRTAILKSQPPCRKMPHW